MSKEQMPEPQYDAHVEARNLHQNVERAESAIKAANLKGKELKAAYELLEAYKSGNVTTGTIEAFALLTEKAATTGPIMSVLKAIYGIDAKLSSYNPRMRQVAASAAEWTDEMHMAELDRKHDGLVNAAARGAKSMVNGIPMSSLASMPLKLMRTAYRGTRTVAGVVPGLEQDPKNLTLIEYIDALANGSIPASDKVVEYALSKLPSKSGVRAALTKGISLAALAQPELGVIVAGAKLQDTAETAKYRALLAVRAERMEEATNETVVVDLTKIYEEEEMHAAGEQTDQERKAA